MLGDKEADPSSILFFVLGIAIAASAFFALVQFEPGAKPTHFVEHADNWQSVSRLSQIQGSTVRNSRSM